jgi:hypothetical protein
MALRFDGGGAPLPPASLVHVGAPGRERILEARRPPILIYPGVVQLIAVRDIENPAVHALL